MAEAVSATPASFSGRTGRPRSLSRSEPSRSAVSVSPSRAATAAAIRRCGTASGRKPTARQTWTGSAVTGRWAMIARQVPEAASRSSVGTMSLRIAQLTQAWSTSISSSSTMPVTSETVRVSTSRPGSTSCRTTTAEGRSHCIAIVTAAIGPSAIPLTRITGTRASPVTPASPSSAGSAC